MQVLVTGGAGFIGSHVVDALVAEGHRVRVIDAYSEAAHAAPPAYLRDDVDYVAADLCDLGARGDVVAGADAVAHLASRVGLGRDFDDAPDYARDNALGTAVLLAALHATGFAGRLALASSMVVYGEGRYRANDGALVRPPPRTPEALAAGRFEPVDPRTGEDLRPEAVPEDAPLDPQSTYAATKVHQEHLCRVFGAECGVPVTALRYHNVYGPRMPRDTPYAGVASIFRTRPDVPRRSSRTVGRSATSCTSATWRRRPSERCWCPTPSREPSTSPAGGRGRCSTSPWPCGPPSVRALPSPS
jgi:dTDP-L-rhamnose 4-epimerase